jgi:phosphomannomutase
LHFIRKNHNLRALFYNFLNYNVKRCSMVVESNVTLDAATERNVQAWLNGGYDEETKDHIRKLLKEDPQEIVNSFYTNLSFGTGGIRGIMGVGCNRMNKYTVRAATAGMAHYIAKAVDVEAPSVFIGYDSRNNSRFFAEEAAKVLAAYNIKAYLSKELRSTPLVSYGCRHYHCTAAIMITASHNPPEYNGYKVYWSDGGQIVAPHDVGIIEEVTAIKDAAQVPVVSLDHELIVHIGGELDEHYLEETRKLQHYPEQNSEHGKSLNIVYTSLHGTGITIVPRILNDWGFSSVSLVEEQAQPDGNFPTVKFPNPEEVEAMELGVAQLRATSADILLGTDPDNDRMGAIVMHDGEAIALTGNQIASICMYHISQALTLKGTMPEDGAFVTTIVSTELMEAIARSFGKPCFDVLTGFKHIAKMIYTWEHAEKGHTYLFGAEESYGYLLGTHARDKDAAVASALICEIALHAKLHDKTLVDLLYDLYDKYGIYREGIYSLKFSGTKENVEKMKNMMKHLRESPPASFNDSTVVAIEDYQLSKRLDVVEGTTEELTLPQSNVLIFWLEDGTKLAIRPSGTEPKVKIYCGVVHKDFKDMQEGIAAADTHVEASLAAVKDTLMTM